MNYKYILPNNIIKKSDIQKESIKRQLADFYTKITVVYRTYRELSSDLGIQTFNTNYNVVTGINDELNRINEELNNISIYDENVVDNVSDAEKIARNSFGDLTQQYETNCFKEVKVKLNNRVKKLIETCIRTNAEERILYVESERDSILNKITGRNKLKEAKINNITTRLNYEIEQNRASNPQNRIRGILSDIYKCADTYSGGTLPPEMKEIENAIRRNFKVGEHNLPSRAELSEKATTYGDNLPSTKRKQPRFFKWLYEKREIESLDADTHQLNNETQKLRNSQPNKLHKVEVTAETSYSIIVNTLRNIRVAVSTE